MLDAHRLDGLITCCGTMPQHQPDSIYLTGCAPTALCTAVVAPDGGIAQISSEPLVEEVGRTDAFVRSHFDAIIEAAQQLQIARRRIGLTGLASDGQFPLGLIERLRAALPHVEWVDVSPQLREIRSKKSQEELAALQSAAARLDDALTAAVDAARPGETELGVWGAAVRSLVRAGSDVRAMHWASGLRPAALPRPTHAPLQHGSYFVADIAATDAGYAVHAVQPFAVQSCDVILRDLHEAQTELWHGCFPLFTSGRSIGDIVGACAELLAKLKTRPGRYQKVEGRLQLVGCGLGSDHPSLSVPLGTESSLDGCIEVGHVFELKPSLSLDIASRVLTAAWSDPIYVSADGPVRLGSRPVGLAVTA